MLTAAEAQALSLRIVEIEAEIEGMIHWPEANDGPRLAALRLEHDQLCAQYATDWIGG